MINSFLSTRFYQIFLVQLLSVSLILSPTLTYATQDGENDNKASKELNETSKDEPEFTNQAQIDQLRKEVLGTSATHPSSLDPFMMVRQQVIDPRRGYIDALVEEEAYRNYREKKHHYEKQVRELEDQVLVLEDEIKSLLQNSNQTSKNFSEIDQQKIQAVLTDKKNRLAIAMMFLEETLESHPSKAKQSLHSFIDQELSTRHHFRLNKNVKLKNAAGELVRTVNEKDFLNSLSPIFSSPEMVITDDAASFEITRPGRESDEILHNFDVPVSFLTFFGHFLIFYEKDSIFYDNYTTLKFIDLKYAASNIGNTLS